MRCKVPVGLLIKQLPKLFGGPGRPDVASKQLADVAWLKAVRPFEAPWPLIERRGTRRCLRS
jgi:hypothetical protein